MARKTKNLKPHGTYAAFMRHKRAGEEPCPACREASRKNAAAYRARKKAAEAEKVREATRRAPGEGITERPVKHDGVVTVRQTVAYGQSVEVQVPATLDVAEIAKDLLYQGRAAVMTASARDMPALMKQVIDTAQLVKELSGEESAETRLSLADQLAEYRRRREAREAA